MEQLPFACRVEPSRAPVQNKMQQCYCLSTGHYSASTSISWGSPESMVYAIPKSQSRLRSARIETTIHRHWHRSSQYSTPARRALQRIKGRSKFSSIPDSKSEVDVQVASQKSNFKWQQHVLFCGVGLGLASVHRVTLAILAVPFQEQFFITLPQMGFLQSAMLWGYVLGQLPTGLLADKWGGSLLMTTSLISWCFASLLMPFAAIIPSNMVFYFIFLERFLLGLFQSGIVTSTAAMSSRWVPGEHRSKAMGFCYFLYSGGVVVGLWATPLVAKPFGWPAVYVLYTAIGWAWAAYGAFGLPKEPEANYLPPKKVQHGEGPAPSGFGKMSNSTKLQVAVLIWTHSVIGWGFTLLQNWIPTILAALGMTDLGTVGIVSALPWVAASGVSLAGGFIADWLYKEKNWTLVEVRRFSQNMASLGPAASLLTLAVWKDVSISTAVGLLVAAAGLQAFAYAGFHSYAQDVCPKDVGRLLGMTNTGGTVVGVICNLMTGSLAGGPLGFSSVFYICALVYFSSFVTWNLFMKGEKFELT